MFRELSVISVAPTAAEREMIMHAHDGLWKTISPANVNVQFEYDMSRVTETLRHRMVDLIVTIIPSYVENADDHALSFVQQIRSITHARWLPTIMVLVQKGLNPSTITKLVWNYNAIPYEYSTPLGLVGPMAFWLREVLQTPRTTTGYPGEDEAQRQMEFAVERARTYPRRPVCIVQGDGTFFAMSTNDVVSIVFGDKAIRTPMQIFEEIGNFHPLISVHCAQVRGDGIQIAITAEENMTRKRLQSIVGKLVQDVLKAYDKRFHQEYPEPFTNKPFLMTPRENYGVDGAKPRVLNKEGDETVLPKVTYRLAGHSPYPEENVTDILVLNDEALQPLKAEARKQQHKLRGVVSNLRGQGLSDDDIYRLATPIAAKIKSSYQAVQDLAIEARIGIRLPE